MIEEFKNLYGLNFAELSIFLVSSESGMSVDVDCSSNGKVLCAYLVVPDGRVYDLFFGSNDNEDFALPLYKMRRIK